MSAFFSGAETIIISASQISLSALRDNKKYGARQALYVLSNMENALGMLLIGNNIVNIAATSLVVYVATMAFKIKSSQLLFVTIIQSLIFLLICEIIPKVISRAYANNLLRILALPIIIMIFILKPLVKISLFVSNLVKKIFNYEHSEYSANKAREEINILFKLGEKAGIIDENHHTLIDEILLFHKKTVSEVMTPTIEIVSIEQKQGIRSLCRLIAETRFSRIPVYSEKIDNIVGYAYYRDFLTLKNVKIADVMRPAVYVPATKQIFSLYQEMRTNKKHLVFAVNEYGGVEGLVTREDIAEEVVGEIQTKDHFEEDLIVRESSKKFSFNGLLDIDYFSRYFNVKIEKKGFETVAGFLGFLLGYIPAEGEKIKYERILFNIDTATDKVISRISVTISYKKKR